jgi:hypothetical protein
LRKSKGISPLHYTCSDANRSISDTKYDGLSRPLSGATQHDLWSHSRADYRSPMFAHKLQQPYITRVCSLVRAESLSVWYRHNTFRIFVVDFDIKPPIKFASIPQAHGIRVHGRIQMIFRFTHIIASTHDPKKANEKLWAECFIKEPTFRGHASCLGVPRFSNAHDRPVDSSTFLRRWQLKGILCHWIAWSLLFRQLCIVFCLALRDGTEASMWAWILRFGVTWHAPWS